VLPPDSSAPAGALRVRQESEDKGATGAAGPVRHSGGDADNRISFASGRDELSGTTREIESPD